MKKRLLAILILAAFIVVLTISFYASNKPDSTSDVAKNSDTQILAEAVKETPVEVEEIYAKPSRLQIPKLGIDAYIEFVGENEEGRMDVPKKDENVAWWKFGTIPGQTGSAVIAGHFDRKDGGPAVFYELESLKIGDEINILDEGGVTRGFRVIRKEIFKDETFPLQEVFADNSGKRLNLITCEGVFDRNTNNYSDRLVIFSELVD